MKAISPVFALLFLPVSLIANSIPLSELLTDATADIQDVMTFVSTSKNPEAISEVRIHFLSSGDCYSRYVTGVRIKADKIPFSLLPQHPFALSGRGIYQAVQAMLGTEGLSDIHAVLIRFVNQDHGQRYQQFARFLGSCQDQAINCCIPIDCSISAGVCTAKSDIAVQPITWSINADGSVFG